MMDSLLQFLPDTHTHTHTHTQTHTHTRDEPHLTSLTFGLQICSCQCLGRQALHLL
jgi:hypothetical protein